MRHFAELVARRFATRSSPDHSVAAATAAVAAQVDALRARLRLPPAAPLRLAVGLSGGVDSAVTAALLREAGAHVAPVYLRSWDASDEAGEAVCSHTADLASARAVAGALGLPLAELDGVRAYWTDVFTPFLAAAAAGATPNPDLACNRHVKFGALLAAVTSADGLGAHALATGHYARLAAAPGGAGVALLRGLDPSKDQSYFLASVPGAALARTLFPLGALTKSHVRAVAAALALPSATRRSSAGICFVGRRSFPDFLAGFLPRLPGQFVDVTTQRSLGPHGGRDGYTHGQRARLGGAACPWFVVGKRAGDHAVWVAPGARHSALYARACVAGGVFWVNGPPPSLLRGEPVQLLAKARYAQPPAPVTVRLARVGEAPDPNFAPSAFCAPLSPAAAAANAGLAGDEGTELRVVFQTPTRAVTPGQALALYTAAGECLGGGVIRHPGRSLFETGEAMAPGEEEGQEGEACE